MFLSTSPGRVCWEKGEQACHVSREFTEHVKRQKITKVRVQLQTLVILLACHQTRVHLRCSGNMTYADLTHCLILIVSIIGKQLIDPPR